MGDRINHQKATKPDPEHNHNSGKRVPGTDNEFAEHDALEKLSEVLEELDPIGPRELATASTTATAILEAMQQISNRLAASTQPAYDGPAPDHFSEQLASLAYALESVTHLIEIYSDLTMEE